MKYKVDVYQAELGDKLIELYVYGDDLNITLENDFETNLFRKILNFSNTFKDFCKKILTN